MEVSAITSDFAFSRNPIILQGAFPVEDPNTLPNGVFKIRYQNVDIYEGRFSPPLSINVAEIIDAYVTYFPEPPADNTDPLCQIEGSQDLDFRRMLCSAEYDSVDREYNCIVLPGGISRQNYERYWIEGADVFQSRFLYPACNFFMTTRTASWSIVMKETELYPLYFIVQNDNDEIKIMAPEGSSYVNDNLEPGIAVLDIGLLRKYFVEDKNILPSVFEIYYNDNYSCRIVVEKSENVMRRHRLKFRNSLGVFEIIELTGEISVSPEYTEAEDAKFKRYNKIIDDFVVDRDRIECRQTIAVDTGVKRPDEIRFLMDMLSSDEVYLLDLTSMPLKVIPSIEEVSYDPHPEKPQNFTIKLEIPFSEENILPDIADGSDSVKPRVHSYHFTKTFN